ncbi:MAG TPA: DUF4241 domain-containing protein, partial [Chitinophagaceae bacterium]|nr:DUF4241 domain-containing protein [Chitinophagaceae bacterium]
HPRHNSSLKVSTEPLDTIKTMPAKIVAAPVLFETAFIKGTTQQGRVVPIGFYGVTIGKIKIVSGHIIACDPLHTGEYGIPYTQLFPTGEFPVQLSIAQTGEEDLTAFARINFSDEPVVKWELALLAGQKPLPVGDEDIHAFGVDGGIGIFVDEEAKKALDKSKLIDDELYGPLNTEMDKHYHNTWRYTMYNFGQHNLAAFTTGKGDGLYATYIGFDANGKVCRLVSDFGLFDWRKK